MVVLALCHTWIFIVQTDGCETVIEPCYKKPVFWLVKFIDGSNDLE